MTGMTAEGKIVVIPMIEYHAETADIDRPIKRVNIANIKDYSRNLVMNPLKPRLQS